MTNGSMASDSKLRSKARSQASSINPFKSAPENPFVLLASCEKSIFA